MKKALALGVLVAVLSAMTVRAQDPLKVAPQAYQRVMENNWVLVTRVRYGPKEKIPEHDHTARASAYVYLNDGGPVIFKHINLPYADVTRAATKAGSFRVYKGLKEVHAVENPTETPSDFLRVEFKTDPVNPASLRGKFFREAYPPGENFSKVQFENEQIRISRVVLAPRAKLDVSSNATEPVLLISLTPAQVKASGRKTKAAKFDLVAGGTHWLEANQTRQWENVSENPVEMLRFEFKTKPVADTAAPHEHKHD